MNLPDRGSWRWSNIRRDILSSLVVFLVALPLCMGISIACGMPVTSGLIAGIVGGLVVATIAGSPLQVTGPAAGLVVVVHELVREFGVPLVGIVVLLAGLIQVVAGMLRLAQWFRAVSPTVIHAMLSGIGILIVASQLHVMVDDRPRENGLKNLQSLPEAFVKGIPWPSLDPREENIKRVKYLQRFGDLHEMQVELSNNVDAHVSQRGTLAEHKVQGQEVIPLANSQRQLIAELEAEVASLQDAKLFGNKYGRATAVKEKAQASLPLLQQALHDLEEGRWETVRESQHAAATGIQAILPPLKSHDWAAKVGLFTILVIIGWTWLPFKALKTVPATLIAVAAATIIAWIFALPVNYVEIPERFADGIVFPSMSVLKDVSIRQLVISALLVAVIASAETLLCASAVDRMHTGPRTKYDQELIAQGIGNAIGGALGGLPMTGVIVRSAANVQAGARTRLSSFLHGAWLLICVLFFGSLLQMIPTACLAGILVYTGYRLIDFKTLKHLWWTDKSEAGIFLVTTALIVCEDLLLGVIAGTVLAALKLLMMFSHLRADLSIESRSRTARLELAGAATFLRLPILAAVLEKVPPGVELHVDLKRLNYLDHACLELLQNWRRQQEENGGRLIADWGQLQSCLQAANGKSPIVLTPPAPQETPEEQKA